MSAPHYGILDNTCLVELSHPTNLGLLNELAVTPLTGWSGGKTFRDLIRGVHKPYDAALQSGASWGAGKGRRGGYGHFQTNASTDFAKVSGWNKLTKITYSAWAYYPATATNYPQILETIEGGASDRALFGSASGWTWDTYDGAHKQVVGGATPAVATWYFVAGTADGSNMYLHVNAARYGPTAAGPAYTAYTNPDFRIGNSISTSSIAAYDDICFWNRALNANELYAVYDQQMRGNPDRWRWVKGTVFSFPATAAPATSGLLLRRRRAVA